MVGFCDVRWVWVGKLSNVLIFRYFICHIEAADGNYTKFLDLWPCGDSHTFGSTSTLFHFILMTFFFFFLLFFNLDILRLLLLLAESLRISEKAFRNDLKMRRYGQCLNI